MSNLISPQDLVTSVISDLAKPSMRGDYQLIFTSDSPFSDPVEYLDIRIGEKGDPSVGYPSRAISKDDFMSRLGLLISLSPGKFRPNSRMALVTVEEANRTGESWGWKIEPNGHLTPEDAIVGDIQLQAGWTINQTIEIATSLVEHLSILNTTLERLSEHSSDKFIVQINVNGHTVNYHAEPQPNGSFALDRDDYPENYLGFKNASYVYEDCSLVVLMGGKRYRWEVAEGNLVPAVSQDGEEGWDISVTDEERDQIIETFTVDADQSDMNPDPRNIEANEDQISFFRKFVPEESGERQHLLYVFTTPDDGKGYMFTTRVDLLPQGYVIEVPEVFDYLTSDERKQDGLETTVVIQSLESVKDGKPSFSYRAWNLLPDDSIVPLSEEEITRYVVKR